MSVIEQMTKNKILDAAEAQFRRFGPKKTSMEEIARQAGLSRATLYLHFSGKKALYKSLLETITECYIAEIQQLVDSEREAPRKLRLFVEITAKTYTNNPVLLAAIIEDVDFSMQKVAAPIMAKYRDLILNPLRQILNQGINERSIRKLKVHETTYLMYELGNRLLIKELSGNAEYPLSKILDVMDDIVAKGILQNS